MTNLERIKQMSVEEMAEFLSKVDDNGSFATHVMCAFVCEYNKDGNCTYPDEDGCATFEINDKTSIKMWLMSDKGEW